MYGQFCLVVLIHLISLHFKKDIVPTHLSCGDTVVFFRARWSVDVLGLDADQGLCR